MSHLFCYLWEDIDTSKTEVKFGEHFISKNLNPLNIQKQIDQYIRSSLGKQKHKFDQGRIKIHKIWDVSDYAKSINKFYQHSKIDDLIRKKSGLYNRQGRGEFHQMEAQEAINFVQNNELLKENPK